MDLVFLVIRRFEEDLAAFSYLAECERRAARVGMKIAGTRDAPAP